MKLVDVFITQLQNARNRVTLTLQGLGEEQLNYLPSANAHSIGFALWHALRAWDNYYALITNTESIYEKENWAQRFGFDTRGKGVNDIGTGFTAQDVAEMQLNVQVLNEFLERLLEHTVNDLKEMDDDVLLRAATVPWWNESKTTFARVLLHIIAHTYNHIGEADYLRGLQSK